MKKIAAILILVISTVSCRKVEVVPAPAPIDLGVKSMATGIKAVQQVNNVVTIEFITTIGAKYAVQVIPFGKEEPVKKDGFTATDSVTKKIYNLAELDKKDYDLIFIDIQGKEVKHPIVIK